MRDFIEVMRKYVPPYKKYVGWAVVLNILSAIFNIFSFTMLIPIFKILFKMTDQVYHYIPITSDLNIKDYWSAIMNNGYWYITQMIDKIGAGNTLLITCAFLGIMTLFKTACYFGSSAVMIPISKGVLRDMRIELYQKIMSLPLSFFSHSRKGDMMARMTGDVGEVESCIMSSLDMLLKNPILIIIYFITMLVVSWKLTLFTIAVVPAIVWVMGVVGKKLRKSSREAQELWSDQISIVEESLGGLRVIKAFTAENAMTKRFSDVTNQYRRKSTRVSIRQTLAHPMSEFLGTSLIMLVLWFGGTLILSNNSPIEAPTFMFYMVILYSIINPIKDFARATYSVPRGLASVERLNSILRAENNIKEIDNPTPINGFKDEIKISNLNFFYEDSKQILKDINVTIKKGQTVAIVGESGAGKSTLVDLIPRFYDATSGSISIDGVDVKNAKLHDLRSIMGYVNQEPILFNDSIYNNIAFGTKNVTMEDVIAAAKIANAHDFIMEKEDGYMTNIGDRGTKLSGGQRQRISIARAILKNPPILILDEATASLDTESEKQVQEAIVRLMESRTTIAIAHRLSTIKNADIILVMSNGKIVERGKHEELIALNGYYKKLNDMQSL